MNEVFKVFLSVFNQRVSEEKGKIDQISSKREIGCVFALSNENLLFLAVSYIDYFAINL